jgi:hypothetical protein
MLDARLRPKELDLLVLVAAPSAAARGPGPPRARRRGRCGHSSSPSSSAAAMLVANDAADITARRLSGSSSSKLGVLKIRCPHVLRTL